MKLIFALVLALVTGNLSAAFFEPTAEESAKNHVALKAQYDRYREARAAKDWPKVRELALFHFTRAWAFNNEAFELLQNSNDGASLLKAISLYENALTECALAEKKGRYLDEVRDCRAKATKSLAVARKRLARIDG
jgi:hypothetical protein